MIALALLGAASTVMDRNGKPLRVGDRVVQSIMPGVPHEGEQGTIVRIESGSVARVKWDRRPESSIVSSALLPAPPVGAAPTPLPLWLIGGLVAAGAAAALGFVTFGKKAAA